MAELNDRGQLLIAGAFVLAVALIALTLIFSASNYTDTLAGQEDSVASGSDAITVRDSVRANVGAILAYVNSRPNPPGEADFRANLTRYANATAAFHARNGRFVNATLSDTTPGYRLVQTTERNFTSPSAENNWTVPASPTDRFTVRNATFNFTWAKGSGPGERFAIEFNVTDGDSTTDRNNWTVTVYDDGGARIRVTEEGGYDATCARDAGIGNATTAGEPLVVDLSEGTYDGRPCPALEQLSPATPYSLNITNGNYTGGKYRITTNEQGGFGRFDAGPTFRRDTVLYDATVQYRYHAPRVDYVTKITVAPGEIS